MALATDSHNDALTRIKAFECLAKHGWASELKGEIAVTLPPLAVTVIHKHVSE